MLPCQRKTSSQSRMRRSHDALCKPQAVTCPNCGEFKRPHTACTHCGYVRRGLRLKIKEA